MEILVKVGDRDYQTTQDFDKSLRDGHVLEIREDGFFVKDGVYRGRAYGFTTVVLLVPYAFSNFSTKAEKLFMNQFLLRGAFVDGKWPWEPGYIQTMDLPPSQREQYRAKRHEYFVDFDRLLALGWITQTQHKSLYNYSEQAAPIWIDRDWTTLVGREGVDSRTTFARKNMAWTTGSKTVGSAGCDYTSWTSAIDDLGDLTGDATIIGQLNETRTENAILADMSTSTYTLTLKANAAVKHNGTYSGHRIVNGTTFNTLIDVKQASGKVIGNFVLQDLSVDCSGDSSIGIRNEVASGASASYAQIIQRNVVKCNSATYIGIFAQEAAYHPIIRNNVVYGASNNSLGYGIRLYTQYAGSSSEDYVYNNTVCKCRINYSTEYNSAVTGLIHIKDNIAQGSTGTSHVDYLNMGSVDVTSKNISEDATSPDAAYRSINLHDGTSCFADYTNDDYDLDADGDEVTTLDDADDLSAIGAPEQFSDDIVDRAR